jgi:hypothetical protein
VLLDEFRREGASDAAYAERDLKGQFIEECRYCNTQII